MASRRASPASPRSSASVPSTWRCARREVRSISAADSSSVAAWVTRETSSCASSITTTSYSGIIGTPSTASIASREWLVDDQLRVRGPLLGALGEALGAVGASARAEALAVADADLAPDPVGVAGRVVALAGAALLRLLLDPVAKAEHLGAQGALGEVDERALVVRDALAHAVQAGVVGAALEHGVRRPLTELLARGVEQRRDVPLHQLVLQGERRRGHHHAVVVQQRRHEVAERLAGAGACLDEQVTTALHGLGDGLRHRHLAGPLLAAELAHRGVEDRTDCRLLDHPSTLCRAADPPHCSLYAGFTLLVPPGEPQRSEPRVTAKSQAGCSYAASSPARDSLTRAVSRVPSAVCSTESTSPFSWTRLTRSPRS